MDLSKLERILGVEFGNKALCLRALTHKSFGGSSLPASKHNGQLLIIGEAVFVAIIAEHICMESHDMSVGDLSIKLSRWKSEQSLRHVASKLGIQEFIRMGSNEVPNDKIVVGALKAIMGAIHLDMGYDEAQKVVASTIIPLLPSPGDSPARDPKTDLQELLQERGIPLPRYVLESTEGPDHDQTFTSAVHIDGVFIARGSGKSKRKSELEAASRALEMERQA